MDAYYLNSKVFDHEYGWGTIKDISYPIENYPIAVLFENNKMVNFTKDGRASVYDKNSRLSFKQYDLIKGGFVGVPRNVFIHDNDVYVKNSVNDEEWVIRKYAYGNYCYPDNLSSSDTKNVVKWRYIKHI